MAVSRTRTLVGIFLLAVLLIGAGALVATGPRPAPCDGCNVVHVQVDLLRPDHMGVYGYQRNTTPFLERLANDSYVFTRHFATAGTTWPATASVMTGTYPSQHRMVTSNLPNQELEAENRMLAEVLRDRGYRTVALVDETLLPQYGFDQGFDRYRDVTVPAPRFPGAVETLQSGGADPFYLYLETVQLHTPYIAPPGYRDRFTAGNASHAGEQVLTGEGRLPLDTRVRLIREGTELTPVQPSTALLANESLAREKIAQYDGTVRYIDDVLRRTVARLKADGHWNDTVLIVTASHGESLGEHRNWGHNNLRNEVLRVPLIMRIPGREDGGIVDSYTSTVDVLPTVLDVLGIRDHAVDRAVSGVSVTPLLTGDDIDRRYILAEGENGAAALIDARRRVKYFNPATKDGERLYNLTRDFDEVPPIIEPEITRSMRSRLRAYYRDVPDEGRAVVNETWPYRP